jgi:hypothetical protein
MVDETNKPASVKVTDRPHAPIVFFDEAPVFNNYNGIIGITISANVSIPDGRGSITSEQVVAAYLRGNIQAFTALKNAIDSAILLGAKIEGEAN